MSKGSQNQSHPYTASVSAAGHVPASSGSALPKAAPGPGDQSQSKRNPNHPATVPALSTQVVQTFRAAT